MAGESKTTINHDEIKKWVEERNGKPSTVKATKDKNETGILRIDFPGYSGEDTLKEITWDEFFEKFDRAKLAFLYQDELSSGKESRFFKFINRDNQSQRNN